MDIINATGKDLIIVENTLKCDKNSPIIQTYNFSINKYHGYEELTIRIELYSLIKSEGRILIDSIFLLKAQNRGKLTENDINLLTELTMIAEANTRTCATLLTQISKSQLPSLKLMHQIKPQIENIVLLFLD